MSLERFREARFSTLLKQARVHLKKNDGKLSGSFSDGWRAAHEGNSPSRNTVIGHSYGSTLIGHSDYFDEGTDSLRNMGIIIAGGEV